MIYPKYQHAIRPWICAASLAVSLAAGSGQALAADKGGNVQVPLAGDVVPAPDGLARVTGKYVTAEPTDVYISPFIWAGKVKNVHIAAGQPLDVLAKPKGYDWLLIGKGGKGIGYVPLSVLKDADR
jgi:hypothetical protein